MRWAARGFQAYYRNEAPGTLFGIVQGGVYLDLRLASLAALEDIGFAGLAVGGLAVGESQTERERVLDELGPHLPAAKPRYLMGVGRPEDILESVRRGIDMFDYSRSYLRHLDKCKEILGAHLNTVHNLYFYQRLMREIRGAIETRRLDAYTAEFYGLLRAAAKA